MLLQQWLWFLKAATALIVHILRMAVIGMTPGPRTLPKQASAFNKTLTTNVNPQICECQLMEKLLQHRNHQRAGQYSLYCTSC